MVTLILPSGVGCTMLPPMFTAGIAMFEDIISTSIFYTIPFYTFMKTRKQINVLLLSYEVNKYLQKGVALLSEYSFL